MIFEAQISEPLISLLALNLISRTKRQEDITIVSFSIISKLPGAREWKYMQFS
jgi:hypothetical protein